MVAETLRKLAYVEDEADIRTIAQMALQMMGGYEVALYASGEEALQQLPQDIPQLLLMDVMMPGQNGPGVLEAMRQIPALQHVPVIFMTAKAQQAEVDYYKSLGAIGVITKPFDPMQLAHEVAELWQQR